MARFDAADIRSYYDRNTAAFVALGQGGGVGAIHRAVWGPGIRTRDDAFHFVEDRIADCLRRLHPPSHAPHVVDLGCGVAASLCYLAGRLPIRGEGITLSPVQARLGEQRILDVGYANRIRCMEGDYCELPVEAGDVDVVYAIESFVHGSDPARFLRHCSRLLRPGGLLVICDDFRRATSDREAAPAIAAFCQGWHVNTLLTPDQVRTMAQATGLEHESTVDLSKHLEIHRIRDRAVNFFLAACRWLPLDRTPFGHLVGGSALQTCLARGWIGYDLAMFRRAG